MFTEFVSPDFETIEVPTEAADYAADHADDCAHESQEAGLEQAMRPFEALPGAEAADRAVFSNLMTKYLRDVRRYRPLDAAREAALVARFSVEGDTTAKNELICHHLGLVIAMARKFSNRGLDLLDLIEEGNLAMMVALQKFDASRGLRFSTYAAWWIRYYLQTAIATQVPIVRPPLRAQRRAGQQAWDQWCDSHTPAQSGSDASPAGDASARSRTESNALVTSLALHDEDIETHFAAANICHPDVIWEASAHLDSPRISTLLRNLVADLPKRQRDLVKARFGLDGQDECSLQDLGTEQGVSRERMRQVQVTALTALREALTKAGVNREAALC
jgi:RNA polymerase sigma factor (sigma-70 family)